MDYVLDHFLLLKLCQILQRPLLLIIYSAFFPGQYTLKFQLKGTGRRSIGKDILPTLNLYPGNF